VTASAARQIESLRNEIRRHDRLYYVEARPEITDREYDAILEKLRQLEEKHPELIAADSPTQRIGDEPVPELESVTHRVPMLSIDNTYSADDLAAWGRRVEKLLHGEGHAKEPIRWVLELKIDGVAVSLTFADGLLALAATRGNGTP
jgi:DNA ligase (NAD+)